MSFARRMRRKGRPRQPPLSIKGELLGKPIGVTGEVSNRNHGELEDHLRRFNLTWMLRRLGEVSAQIPGQAEIEGVGVMQHALSHCAMVAIEVGDDGVSTVPAISDVVEAARLFNGLREPSIRGDKVFEFLVRMGYEQFTQFDLRHAVARTWLICAVLWQQVPQAAAIDVVAAIESITGLDLGTLIVLALVHRGRASQGHVTRSLGDQALSALEQMGATDEEEAKFLSWASTTYQEFREAAARFPASSGLERYRPNPLLRWPLLRPDVAPDGATTPVYLAPVPAMVVRRVTEGLFYDLAAHLDRGGRDNPFREAFGWVFQAYVGHLLRSSHGEQRVLAEWEYGPRRRRVRTPDWLVLEGERLVVIEVKEGTIRVETKATGDRDAMVRDLEKSLRRAVQQLLRFKQDLRARVTGLEPLQHVQHVELMIVVRDRMPFANWVFKKVLGIPAARDVHICSIEEFELLQERCWGDGLFDLLEAKRTDDRGTEQDFREWCYELGGTGLPHPAIERAFRELSARWHTPEERR